MKLIDAEQKLNITIYDEQTEQHIVKCMSIEEILDTCTNEGCPTCYLKGKEKRKTGHWMILKDEYGDIVEAVCPKCYMNGRHEWAYCPNCGLKMVKGEQNIIEKLPSTRPEPLTDAEQRIFLAAMAREEKVCKQTDDECRNCREPYEVSLVSVCHEITRKVKSALWSL